MTNTGTDGVSPNKIRKMSLGPKTTETNIKQNDFSAIKSEVTMAFDPSIEPLLRENPKRFVIFPIQYKDIWDMYKKVFSFEIKFEMNFFSYTYSNENFIGRGLILDS